MEESFIESIVVFFHVIGVVSWLSASFSMMVVFYLFKKSLKDELASTSVAKKGLKILIIEALSAIVLLVTGGYLVRRKWFDFSPGNAWLALKQLTFLVLLFGIFLTLFWFGKRMRELESDSGSEKKTDEFLLIFKKKVILSYVFSALIVLNIFLAIVRPF